MILNILGLAFFFVLWLMAAKGLSEASGPFMRRLSLWRRHIKTRHYTSKSSFSPAIQS